MAFELQTRRRQLLTTVPELTASGITCVLQLYALNVLKMLHTGDFVESYDTMLL